MTQQDYLTFKEKLIKLPNYKKLIDDYNPDIVYLGGSRALNTDIENSDFDLVAIAPKSEILNSLAYKNMIIQKANGTEKTIHCFITTVDYIINVLLDEYTTPNNIFLLNALSTGFNKIDSFEPIMTKEEEKCTKMFKFIKENKIKISKMMFFHLINQLDADLDYICNYNDNNLNLSKKIYYQLLVIYDVMNSIDSSDLIKKLRTNKLTKDEINEVLSRMKELNIIYKNYKDSQYDILKARLEVLRYGS